MTRNQRRCFHCQSEFIRETIQFEVVMLRVHEDQGSNVLLDVTRDYCRKCVDIIKNRIEFVLEEQLT